MGAMAGDRVGRIVRSGEYIPSDPCDRRRLDRAFGRAQEKGIQLAVIDGLVAGTALEHDLAVVTRNVKDFAGLEVKVVNPWEDAWGGVPSVHGDHSH